MNLREAEIKIYLIQAEADGWRGPDYPAELDELLDDAQRWRRRWGPDPLASNDNAGPP